MGSHHPQARSVLPDTCMEVIATKTYVEMQLLIKYVGVNLKTNHDERHMPMSHGFLADDSKLYTINLLPTILLGHAFVLHSEHRPSCFQEVNMR